ncbi:MAG TPA: hypothetical protein DD400_05400 [Rhodospirillaceae bacterium]|nr:hypothetical protein [Rhodospirillaceae bacterium]
MRRTTNHSLHGFTLMEIIIVIGIIGFLLGGVWMATASIREQQRINKAFSNIMIIVQNVKSLYARTHEISSPGNFNTTNMVTAGVFPEEMLKAGVPKSLWDTNVTLSTRVSNAFTLSYTGPIPNLECRNLVGKAVGTERDPYLNKIETGAPPFTGSALDTLSAANTLLDNCSYIKFTFRLK